MVKGTEVLLEYRQEGRKTWAIRFYQDGTVKEYSDSAMDFDGEKVVTRSLPAAWRKIAKLSAKEMEKVREALRMADFFALPDQIGDESRVLDGTRFTWTVSQAGQRKTVQAFNPEASSQPALKILGEMIEEVTADAFDREAGVVGLEDSDDLG